VGDTGYKSIKDNLFPLIEAWEKLSNIELTHGGNPKSSKEEEICN
jgi:hypothetical protein